MFLKEVSGSSIKLVIIGKPIAVKYILERLTGVEPQDDYEEEIHIDELLATLYRPHKPKTKENKRRGYQGDRRQPLLHHEAMVKKRIPHMAILPKSTKQLLTFWFASCRQAIIEEHSELFSAPSRKEANTFCWGGVLMALAGKLQDIDAIAAQSADNALTYLTYLEAQRKELEKKTN